MSEPLWPGERIEEESEAASTHSDDVDGDWVWNACRVMSSTTAETLLEKMRDEYEARIAELEKQLVKVKPTVKQLINGEWVKVDSNVT